MNLADYTWHAVYCRPQFELKTAYRLGALDIRYIVPAEKKWVEVGPGSKKKREKASIVFPMYVFAGFSRIPHWQELRERIPTIYGYMEFGRGPEPLRLEDVEWLAHLRDRLLGAEQPRPFEETLEPGAQVRVIRGPLTGQVLTVNDADAKKIHTFREFLGAMRLVEISIADLAPA